MQEDAEGRLCFIDQFSLVQATSGLVAVWLHGDTARSQGGALLTNTFPAHLGSPLAACSHLHSLIRGSADVILISFPV